MLAWIVTALMMTPAETPVAPDPYEVLTGIWTRAKAKPDWRSPQVGSREVLRDALGALMSRADHCQEQGVDGFRSRLVDVGFSFETIDVGPQRWWVVRQSEGNEGRGLFVIRCGPASPVVLQAPHAFFDRFTGRLVRRLFAEGSARAAFWNTVHRYRATAGERPEDLVHPADVAHQYGSYFHGATLGAALACPELRFVQLHGFDGARLPGQGGVLSGGDDDTPPAALRDKLQLTLAPGDPALGLFGVDVEALGGTTNVQGRALRQLGPHRFAHVELSLPLRKSLEERPRLRRLWLEALEASWW